MNRRQLESDIERRHRQVAMMAGWFVEKIEKTSRGGFPDRFYARGGRVVLVEWKRPGGRLSAQQQLRHQELRAAGVEVHVVYTIEEANRVLGIDA
jgi:hypothetical protein